MTEPRTVQTATYITPAKAMNQNESKTKPNLRLNYIEEHFLFETQEEMAKQLGCSRSTIERDLKEWRENNGMYNFLYREFFELYGLEKRKNPSRALDRILILLLKTIPDKLESKEEVHEYHHVIELVDPDNPTQNPLQTPPGTDSISP